MGIVNLVSGGLDSTLIGVMAREEGLPVYPLFIDYGQRAANKEWETCQLVHKNLALPLPNRMDVSGYGKIICSGLTSEAMHVKDNAFTPGRNLLFLLMGSAYAYQVGASAVAIGLLSEEFSLFPDQKSYFLKKAEEAIEACLAKRINVIAPLMDFSKADVVKLSSEKGITGTYSCHTGLLKPCGLCISCLETTSEAGG